MGRWGAGACWTPAYSGMPCTGVGCRAPPKRAHASRAALATAPPTHVFQRVHHAAAANLEVGEVGLLGHNLQMKEGGWVDGWVGRMGEWVGKWGGRLPRGHANAVRPSHLARPRPVPPPAPPPVPRNAVSTTNGHVRVCVRVRVGEAGAPHLCSTGGTINVEDINDRVAAVVVAAVAAVVAACTSSRSCGLRHAMHGRRCMNSTGCGSAGSCGSAGVSIFGIGSSGATISGISTDLPAAAAAAPAHPPTRGIKLIVLIFLGTIVLGHLNVGREQHGQQGRRGAARWARGACAAAGSRQQAAGSCHW